MKFVPLVCPCGTLFEKPSNEYHRRVRSGQTKFYCGVSCPISAQDRVVGRGRPNPENLRAGNRRDDHTPFRWYVLRAKGRVEKKGPTDLTSEYLQELWAEQRGLCRFSGQLLQLPKDTNGWAGGAPPNAASLDRIDHTKGYVKGNVRFVSLMANLARQQFSDEQLIEFCKAVAAKS